MSAGLCSVRICFQVQSCVKVCISLTLFETNCFQAVCGACIHANTIDESVHSVQDSILKSKDNTLLINLDSKTAPQSSNLGMVVAFKGATLDFEQSNLTDVRSLVVALMYTQAPYALSEASQKPWISILSYCFTVTCLSILMFLSDDI